MARPDLPSPEYGGWQAFDATPQETSGGTNKSHRLNIIKSTLKVIIFGIEPLVKIILLIVGVYQAGPASVHAIKHGEIQLPYDGTFIYAEAASERFNWYHQPDQEPEWRTTVNPKP